MWPLWRSLEGTWSLEAGTGNPPALSPAACLLRRGSPQAFLSSVSSLLLVCNCPDPRVGEGLRLCWPDRLGDTQDSESHVTGPRGHQPSPPPAVSFAGTLYA